ncbi:MAG: hypothetical protein IH823_08790 [Candidatus Dadabacteria bacterium]|nr:hypothetical protein [Candidatus Dadabacteria bacterium]
MTKSHKSKRGGIIVRDTPGETGKTKKLKVSESKAVVVEVLTQGEHHLIEMEEQLRSIEIELLQVKEEDEGIMARLTGSGKSRKQKVENLELTVRQAEAYRKINSELTIIATQMYERKEAILDAQISLFQKNAKAQKGAQKLISEIELQELNTKKLQKEVEKMDWELKKKQKSKELEDEGETDTENYDLKPFKTDSDTPDDQGGSEGGST